MKRILVIFSDYKSVILNLGYASSSQGVHNIIKRTQTKTIWVDFCYLGVCKGVKFLFGGTQNGTILIWGYVSPKRLRTPALNDCSCPPTLGKMFTV